MFEIPFPFALFANPFAFFAVKAFLRALCATSEGIKTSIVPMYHGTITKMPATLIIERVQTGVRLEKRLLKVLKAFAEFKDMTLGDLLEGIVLHAFDGKAPFSEDSCRRIADLKKFYGLDLDSRASHQLKESPSRDTQKRPKRKNHIRGRTR